MRTRKETIYSRVVPAFRILRLTQLQTLKAKRKRHPEQSRKTRRNIDQQPSVLVSYARSFWCVVSLQSPVLCLVQATKWENPPNTVTRRQNILPMILVALVIGGLPQTKPVALAHPLLKAMLAVLALCNQRHCLDCPIWIHSWTCAEMATWSGPTKTILQLLLTTILGMDKTFMVENSLGMF